MMNERIALEIGVYLLTFLLSIYSLSSIKFDALCHVSNPRKVQMLLILLSMGLAYIVSQFLFGIFFRYL